MRAMIFFHINDQMPCKLTEPIYAGGRATQETKSRCKIQMLLRECSIALQKDPRRKNCKTDWRIRHAALSMLHHHNDKVRSKVDFRKVTRAGMEWMRRSASMVISTLHCSAIWINESFCSPWKVRIGDCKSG